MAMVGEQMLIVVGSIRGRSAIAIQAGSFNLSCSASVAVPIGLQAPERPRCFVTHQEGEFDAV